ncbi:MlaA family lipoprotein [Pontiella sulfatireligans]|uniref:Putative phospholipid-binding lipoprotein MlaA n=1 Tax=Pontiella sulfatireligans TaxID=2750658 RepID=A0A6C2UQX6_9BACT|nr:VacJ family lipoprotein [Pontiella sulfatireligans]VGO22628.1 putative phospholipid-binding lipoprotein MlaA [Pontiella sulfatireligans]
MKTKLELTMFGKLMPVMALLIVAGPAFAKKQEAPEVPAKRPVSEYVKADVEYKIDVYDPWEGFNRRMYRFNYGFDKYFFLPVVKTYEFILPKPVEKGVSNFFGNLGEVNTCANCLLQAKGGKAGKTAGRFVINSTVGILGLFDVATKMGIHGQDEDFGQTLGVWGVGNGPYLVLPVLGPSCVRDTGGIVVDGVGHSLLVNGLIGTLGMTDNEERNLSLGLSALRAVDKRHQIGFRYYETGSPFEYEMVRMLITEKRIIQVEN